ncbi:inositol monophosphatase family protein [Lentisphaerota bacterium ZTH]|nr:inositol monophosphatase family protein [Lentisphaerota bacterium]WET05795.1 inositol monophosphatase family protein [Lentisphaerota bacterium ZTH]
MKNWDKNEILLLLRECGRIAMQYYDNPPLEIKADKSVVTAADKAIEKYLGAVFDRPQDGVYLIGEETVSTRSREYLEGALQGTAWIVDPIDGTAPYSAHFPAWGISVALMQNGIITEGAVYLPPQNECLLTEEEAVFRCCNVDGCGRLEPFEFEGHPLTVDGIISISQLGAKYGKFNMPNQVFAWSGCVASFYGVFTGRLLAYVASVKIWDIAASLALLQRSGMVGRSTDGEELTCKVCDGQFDLDFEGKHCWKLKGMAVVAPSREAVDYVIKYSEIPDNIK